MKRFLPIVIIVAVLIAALIVVWLALRWMSRDGRRAALATSLLVTLFYTFNRSTLLVNGILDYLSQFWVPRPHQVPPPIMLTLLTLAAMPILLSSRPPGTECLVADEPTDYDRENRFRRYRLSAVERSR